MKFDLEGKVILVTGASAGAGEEIAKAFAAKKAKVAACGRNIERLTKVRDCIRGCGGTAEMFCCELTDVSAVEKLAGDVEKSFSDSVSVLINNAGVAVLGFVEDVPLEEYMYNLQVNFLAPLALIKAVIPGMKKKKRGQIINISSGVGKRGLPGVSSYCISKSALNSLTESLRVELAASGIDVLSISPGLIKTEFSKKIRSYGKLKEKFTKGKALTAAEVAKRVLLASEGAQREVTMSLRAKAVHHLNYWAPYFVDYVLKKKIEESRR